MKIAIIFIIAFILPFIYLRLLFSIYKKTFNKPYLRTKTGLQIHHGHYGVGLIFIAAIILLFLSRDIWVIVLLGLGLGLIIDESISLMLMPGNRALELDVYSKSFKSTAFLFMVLVLAVLCFAVLAK
jgi:hypothetical protein